MTEVENSLTTTNIRRKLALIMGISNYADNTSLINATNDAKEMSSVLKSMGFLIHDNEPKLNLTYKQMRHCLTDFECSIEAGDLILFYFAGHGTQWEDQNYLIPADNFIEKNQNNMKVRLPLSGPELGTHAINVQNLLNSINDRTPFLIMFILDCCRTYHLRNSELQKLMRSSLIHHSQGLKAMPAHVGSLIAFACAPGTAADDGQNEEKNGLFTKHLLRHIKTPNEDIRMIMAAVTDGVIVESNNAQIPHITSVLRHKYICLYDGKQDLESKLNRWNQHAQTVAGNNRWGEQLSQLHHPYGICIDENRSIYIADWENHRIVQWTSNSNEGEIIIGRNAWGNQTDQFFSPANVVFDQQTHSLIIADRENRRVIRWFNQMQQTLIDNIHCWGLAMDKYGFLYISDVTNDEVSCWKIGENPGLIVAGGNGRGNHCSQLNGPTYIFVDDEQSVYVSDEENHRVMKWRKYANEGIVVAGGNEQGDKLNQLSSPQGLIVDHIGHVYVADFDNHRIMRWCEGKNEGEIVVGGNGQGNRSDQLYCPSGISFDLEGNLYVADCWNNRIQKFELTYA